VEARKLVPTRSQPEDLVLVVDPDRVSSMITARILEKMRYQVECVADATGGLELLQQREVDLMICEASLPDLPATALIAMGQRIYAPQPLPVLVMTVDLRATMRIDLLRAGAIDCLTKPVEAEELRLRVERALQPPAAATTHAGEVHMGGDLEKVRLPDVLTVLDLAKYSGHIDVASNRDVGKLVLSEGRILHAALGKLTGMDALAAILRLSRGWFRAHSGAVGERSLHGSTTQLLLEATVAEANRRRTPSFRAAALDELGVSKTRVFAAPEPDPARLAARLAPLIHDPHRLGEFELSGGEPAPPSQDTFTVTLFGDSPEIVAALWELSAPLGPHVLSAARHPGTSLRWRFHGRDRNQLVVRMVGLDEPSPSWFHLPSDVVIVAAPQTGPLVVDPAIRAYVLSNKIPTLVIAHHDEAKRLFSPAAFVEVAITGQRLSELRGKMRALLSQAIKLRVPS
jgi:DNA-binding response OmpR family regulator